MSVAAAISATATSCGVNARYGWFGMGTALGDFKVHHPKDFERFKVLAKEWPFLKYSLIQIESNLLNSDTEIMRAFADLVKDPSVKDDLMELILKDYQDCLDNIEELMEGSVEQRRISKLENNKLRHEALQVLHEIQINYLSTWRKLREENHDHELSDEYLLQLLLLVNVLSGGLKGTG